MKNRFIINEAPEVRPFYIGDVKIPNPLVLAPMAGVTDLVFRDVIKSMGAGLVYTEMISCFAMHYNNKKTWKLAELDPDQNPVSIQIFGAIPAMMGESAKILEDMGASIIDINMGCSVPKVTKSGAGAALARDVPGAAKVMEAVVNAVKIPVTVKIRIGWTRPETTAFEICRIAEECGIKALAIHGRTSAQKYSGKADWDFIEELTENSRIPIIGNGDIRTPSEVVEKLNRTGCHAVMIGREAYSNPLIFRESLDLLLGAQSYPVDKNRLFRDLILYQLQRETERHGEDAGLQKMRKFIAWYTKGLRHSSRFRTRIFQIETCREVINEVNRFFEKEQDPENDHRTAV